MELVIYSSESLTATKIKEIIVRRNDRLQNIEFL